MIITKNKLKVFVRQGILMQVVEQHSSKGGKARSRLASFASRTPSNQKNQQFHHYQLNDLGHYAQMMYGSNNLDNRTQNYNSGNNINDNHQNTKELIRQCFLFTNHLLLCTRTKDGKLHLLEVSIIIIIVIVKYSNPEIRLTLLSSRSSRGSFKSKVSCSN